MSFFDKVAKTAKSKLASGSKIALKSAGDALNRLDELGGEARDSIKEWYEQSPAMGSVRDYLEKRGGDKESNPAGVGDVDEQVVVDAEIVAESLGDPAVAVQVFGRRSCPWSGRAIRLLEDRDIEYQLVEIDAPENEKYASRLIAETKQNTVPYIYVRGEFLGGFNALDELARLGTLDARIAASNEKSGRIKVEVAPRSTTDEIPPAVSPAGRADDPPN